MCSVSCGFGQRFRKRKYSDLTVNATSCDLALLESEICSGQSLYPFYRSSCFPVIDVKLVIFCARLILRLTFLVKNNV